jgi:hypothetical protein
MQWRAGRLGVLSRSRLIVRLGVLSGSRLIVRLGVLSRSRLMGRMGVIIIGLLNLNRDPMVFRLLQLCPWSSPSKILAFHLTWGYWRRSSARHCIPVC